MLKQQLAKIIKIEVFIFSVILLVIGTWTLLVHITHPTRVLGSVTLSHYKIEVIADVQKGDYCFDEQIKVTNDSNGEVNYVVSDAFGGIGGPCGHYPSSYWIYSEDFNRDGKPDFAVNNPYPNARRETDCVKFIHGNDDTDNPFFIQYQR